MAPGGDLLKFEAADPESLAKVQAAIEWLLRIAPGHRVREARRTWSGEPTVLREILRLLPHDRDDSYLVPPPTGVQRRTTGRRPPTGRGRVLGERWRLNRVIGRGGHGVVWDATDVRAGRSVAVKVIPGVGADASLRVRREVAILRWLRVPGVVRFIDAGREGTTDWIVTEIAPGTPFPGTGRERSWSSIRGPTLALLDVLSGVHAAGIIHGDLAPANVLVDAEGRVTLLDLGLAHALRASPGETLAWMEGTLGYAAPEVAGGLPTGVTTDLYAVGALVQGAITGGAPSNGGAPRWNAAVCPKSVWRTLAALVNPDAARRPTSASAALRELRGGPRRTRRARWTLPRLRRRFAGCDALLHLPGDAARELLRRTGGELDAVESEVESWLRGGLARLQGGLIEIDRPALEHLALRRCASSRGASSRRAAAAARFMDALRRGRAPRVIETGLSVARSELRDGRPATALEAVETVILSVVGSPESTDLDRVYRTACDCALRLATPRDCDRAEWILMRAGEADARARAWAIICRAAAAGLRGEWSDAAHVVAPLCRDSSADLRFATWSVRVRSAYGLPISQARRLIRAAARSVTRGAPARGASARRGDPPADEARMRRIAARMWTARQMYREGACRAALRLYLKNVRESPPGALRVRALVDAADASLESGLARSALALAERARRSARSLRIAASEATASAIARTARFRLTGRFRIGPGELDALQSMGGEVEQLLVIDASMAWRSGRRALARRILTPLLDEAGARDLDAIRVAAIALAGGLGRPPGRERVAQLADVAVRYAAPAAAAQLLALLALAVPSESGRLRERYDALHLPEGRKERARPREFLSLDEADRAIRGAPVTFVTRQRGTRHP